MRSRSKDSSRMVTLSSIIPISGTTDQTGCFSDGTPWKSMRASQGHYDIMFDSRLIPIHGVIGQTEQVRQFLWLTTIQPGFIHVRVMLHDATQTDANFDLNLTCIDTRV